MVRNIDEGAFCDWWGVTRMEERRALIAQAGRGQLPPDMYMFRNHEGLLVAPRGWSIEDLEAVYDFWVIQQLTGGYRVVQEDGIPYLLKMENGVEVRRTIPDALSDEVEKRIVPIRAVIQEEANYRSQVESVKMTEKLLEKAQSFIPAEYLSRYHIRVSVFDRCEVTIRVPVVWRLDRMFDYRTGKNDRRYRVFSFLPRELNHHAPGFLDFHVSRLLEEQPSYIAKHTARWADERGIHGPWSDRGHWCVQPMPYPTLGDDPAKGIISWTKRAVDILATFPVRSAQIDAYDAPYDRVSRWILSGWSKPIRWSRRASGIPEKAFELISAVYKVGQRVRLARRWGDVPCAFVDAMDANLGEIGTVRDVSVLHHREDKYPVGTPPVCYLVQFPSNAFRWWIPHHALDRMEDGDEGHQPPAGA